MSLWSGRLEAGPHDQAVWAKLSTPHCSHLHPHAISPPNKTPTHQGTAPARKVRATHSSTYAGRRGPPSPAVLQPFRSDLSEDTFEPLAQGSLGSKASFLLMHFPQPPAPCTAAGPRKISLHHGTWSTYHVPPAHLHVSLLHCDQLELFHLRAEQDK